MKTFALYEYDVWHLGRVIDTLQTAANDQELAAELPDLEEHLTALRKLVERLRTLDMVA